jgi:hypothetical protein
MEKVRYSIRLLTILSILITCIVIFTSCTNGESNSIVVPEYQGIGPPPLEVTIDQVYADYANNEVDADAKYSEEKLLFSEIEVDEVFGNYFQMGEALGAGDLSYVKLNFAAGVAKFTLREEYFGVMQNIEEGFVLNIIGQSIGLREGLLIIDDCWVESVTGDLGIGEELDFY